MIPGHCARARHHRVGKSCCCTTCVATSAEDLATLPGTLPRMPRTCNGLSGLVEDRAESPLRVSNDCESTRRRGKDLMAKRLQQEKNGWGGAHLKAHPHLHAGQLMCPVARSAEPRRPSTVWAEHGIVR